MSELKKRFNRWKKGEKVYEAGRKLPEVVVTPDEEYNAYLNTLPDNQRLTPNEKYDLKRYWELGGKPKDFDEAIKREMFSLEDDGYYHANSVRETLYGDYEFMKPNVHPTKHFEDEFYENDKQFQKQYRRTFDWTRPGFSKYERNISPLDHINLPKYDMGDPIKSYSNYANSEIHSGQPIPKSSRALGNLMYRTLAFLPYTRAITNVADILGWSPDPTFGIEDVTDGSGLVQQVFSKRPPKLRMKKGGSMRNVLVSNKTWSQAVRPLRIMDLAGDMSLWGTDLVLFKRALEQEMPNGVYKSGIKVNPYEYH